MARPSKKTLELRSKILELKVFKRDNDIYTSFENLFNSTDAKYSTSYYFCEECEYRTIRKRGDKGFSHDDELFYNAETFKSFFEEEDNYPHFEKVFNELFSLNPTLAFLYHKLVIEQSIRQHENWNTAKVDYFTTTELDYSLTVAALGKERTDAILKETGSLTLDWMISDNADYLMLSNPLTKKEKSNLLCELSKGSGKGYNTLVGRIVTPHAIEDLASSNKSKTIHAELDLTKPIDEIIDYVTMLKNDFDNNPDNFKNAYELLGEKQEVFSCELKDCDIYKDTKSPKPINGRLADVLFIYDCKKVNELLGADILTNAYITDEINRYWQEVKNISPDGFNSLGDYYAIAKEYIDEQKYKDYLTGVKHTL